MNIKEIFPFFLGINVSQKKTRIIKNLSYLDDKFFIENFNQKDILVLPDFGDKYFYIIKNRKYQLFYRSGYSIDDITEVKEPPTIEFKTYIGFYSIYISDSHTIDFEIKLTNSELDKNDLDDVKCVLTHLVKLDFEGLSIGGKCIDYYNNHEGYLSSICINNDELIFDYINNYCNSSWGAFFRKEQPNKWTFSEIG